MRFAIDPPKTDQDFEVLGLDLLRRHWNSPELQRYAHEGEKQDGVDVFDPLARAPHRGGQCKLHDKAKPIRPAEIRSEVAKALEYHPPLDHYLILTTARTSKESDDAVKQINLEHRSKGLFTVELLTWTRIEELLDRHPDVRDRWYKTLPAEALAGIRGDLAALGAKIDLSSSGPSSDFIDTELDDSKRALDDGRAAEVRAAVERLLGRYHGRMSDYQRWRAKTQLAFARLTQGEVETAGRLLLEAVRLQPSEPKALLNEAVGYELVGNVPRAHELATGLRTMMPENLGVLAVWVRTSPETLPVDELVRAAGRAADSDDDVSLALAARLAMRDRFDLVERYARTSANLHPGAPHGWLLLGQAIHARSQTADRIAEQERLFQQAEQHYSKTVELSVKKGPHLLLVGAYLNRAVLRGQAGRHDEAEDDFRSALALAPDDAHVHGQHAVYLFLRGRVEHAVEYARRASAASGCSQYEHVYAAALYARNGDGDREQAVRLWSGILKRGDADRSEAALWCAVRTSCELGRPADASELLSRLPAGRVPESVRLANQARVLLEEGDRDQAVVRVREAVAASDVDLGRQGRINLAHLLAWLDLHSEAVPLLTAVARRGAFDDVTRFLLDCAARTDDHGLTLRLCGELREAGAGDRRLRQVEIELLSLYDPREAAGLTRAYLCDHPDDRMVRLRLALLGRECEVPEWITAELDDLPEPADCHPATVGRAVLNLLVGEKRSYEALLFGYGLLRTHPTDADASLAYISLFILGDTTGWPVDSPAVVGPDAAVCVREVGKDALAWLVIEEDSPNELLDEVAPGHPRAEPLLGKRAGDRFVLVAGIQERMGEVIAVRSKYVYRFEWCRDRYQTHFRDRRDFQAVEVIQRRPDGTEAFDPGPIFSGLDRRREQVAEALRHYRQHPVSIHGLAILLGRDVFETMEGLSHPLLEVRCSTGAEGELEAASVRFDDVQIFVLDLTSLNTLWRLDLFERLGSGARVTLGLTQATFNDLRNLADERQSHRSSTHLVSLGEGRYTWEELPLEHADRRHQSLVRLLDWVRARCTVLGCRGLADVAPRLRSDLVDTFGRDGAETISVAGRPGHVLWTDDHLLGICAKELFPGTRRTWTQAVVASAARAGIWTADVCVDATARLIGWRYVSTNYGPATLVRAGVIAGWSADRWPFRQALEQFGVEQLPLAARVRLASDFIALMFGEEASGLVRRSVVRAVLIQMADRAAAEVLRRTLATSFGMNGLAAREAQGYVRDWQRTTLWIP